MNRNLPRSLAAVLLLAAALSLATALHAATDGLVEVRFNHHRFTPQTFDVPADRPLTLKVVNDSEETIEFESFKLNREVAMTPGETITLRLPALSPGSYDFYDDFHQDVPEGAIVAK